MKMSRVLAKDREIREAKFGYGFVATIFGLWFLLRVPSFLYVVSGKVNFAQSLIELVISICILGVCVLAIMKNNELTELREKLSKDPNKYLSVKISGPPVLNTIIPFILK